MTEVNPDEALDCFMKLTAVPGRSGEEAAVAQMIQSYLVKSGVDAGDIVYDDANQKSPIGGNVGNMIVTLRGDESLPRTMLSAHMDTVAVCLGAEPVIDQHATLGRIVRSSAATGLGADDRGGCAAIVTAIQHRMTYAKSNPDAKLPPAVATFLIQEEIGLVGAKFFNYDLVGPVDQAFNFDGGTMDKIRHGAIGGERMQVKIHGYASHAGVAPEKGVSAIVIAAKAIADLHDRSLLGLVQKNGKRGTSNVGIIQGGEATNVITPEVYLKIEARSHDGEFRSWIVSQIHESLERAAAEVTDVSGRSGRIEFSSQVDYEAFVLPEDHPSVVAAKTRLAKLGYDAVCEVANGGLDANWLFRHGIEAVTLGCGQAAIHTVDEHLLVDHYLDACRFATEVLTRPSLAD